MHDTRCVNARAPLVFLLAFPGLNPVGTALRKRRLVGLFFQLILPSLSWQYTFGYRICERWIGRPRDP